MVMVSELALLDLKDALKLALVQSGKTPLEVAREMLFRPLLIFCHIRF